MRRREHRLKSRCQGAGYAWRSHRCDCEALLRGRTSPGRQKTPATRPNHSFRHHAPAPRPVARAEVPTLVLRTMNSRGHYPRWHSPIAVNAAPTRLRAEGPHARTSERELIRQPSGVRTISSSYQTPFNIDCSWPLASNVTLTMAAERTLEKQSRLRSAVGRRVRGARFSSREHVVSDE